MEIDKYETNKDNIVRVDVAIHDASLRQRESHFSLPRSVPSKYFRVLSDIGLTEF